MAALLAVVLLILKNVLLFSVVLQIRSFTWMCVVLGVLGVLRAWLHVSSPLIVSNHVKHADFPGAYALFMLSTGMVNVFCAPVIGKFLNLYEKELHKPII